MLLTETVMPLCSGVSTGAPPQQQQQQQKRPHADSLSETPRDSKDSTATPMTNGQQNGQNKRVKLSPNIEARKASLEQQPKPPTAKAIKSETPQQQQNPGSTEAAQSANASTTSTTNDSSNVVQPQQSPNKILLSLASSQGSSQGGSAPMDASAVFQPQQEQIQELSQQQSFSVGDIQQKREEVKSQMKQFLTSLSSMAKAKQFSMEQARAAAEQVRAEAVKKYVLEAAAHLLRVMKPNMQKLIWPIRAQATAFGQIRATATCEITEPECLRALSLRRRSDAPISSRYHCTAATNGSARGSDGHGTASTNARTAESTEHSVTSTASNAVTGPAAISESTTTAAATAHVPRPPTHSFFLLHNIIQCLSSYARTNVFSYPSNASTRIHYTKSAVPNTATTEQEPSSKQSSAAIT